MLPTSLALSITARQFSLPRQRALSPPTVGIEAVAPALPVVSLHTLFDPREGFGPSVVERGRFRLPGCRPAPVVIGPFFTSFLVITKSLSERRFSCSDLASFASS